MNLNLFSISGALLAITCTILMLILLKYGKTKLHYIWVLFNFFIIIWGIGLFGVGTARSQEQAMTLWKFANVGGIFLSAAFLHAISNFCELRKSKMVIGAYALAFFYSILDFTGLLNYRMQYIFDSLYYIQPLGPQYKIVSISSFLIVGYGFYELFKFYRRSQGIKRKQSLYLLVGTVVGFSGGATHFLPIFGFNIYPFGQLGIAFYALIVTYAIIRHQLMGIKIFFKKTSLILGSGIGLAGGFYYVIIFLHDFLKNRLGQWWLIILLVSGIIFSIFMLKLIYYVFRIKEKEIKQEFEDEREKLNNLVARIEQANRLREALIYIPRYIIRLTPINYAAIAFRGEGDSGVLYQIQAISDQEKQGLRKKLRGNIINYSHLLQRLKDNQIIKYQDGKVFIISYQEKKQNEECLKEQTQEAREIKKASEHLKANLIIPSLSSLQLRGFLILGKKENGYSQDDITFFRDLAQRAGAYLDKLIDQEDNMKMLEIFKEDSLKEIDEKDHYTYWHTKRVAQYSLMIARDIRVRPLIKKISTGFWGLGLAAELHDIGKKRIPDEILKKPGPLTNEELRIMQTHPEKALEVIYKYRPYLKKDVILGIIQHHENYDGSGYPKGIKGEDIHLYAQIIRLADAFDAMTSNRPYRSKLPIAKVIEELKKNRGVQFHPEIVDAFLEELEKQPKLIAK